jgi:hypothetical protein
MGTGGVIGNGGFIACVVLLATLIVGFRVLVKTTGTLIRKEPVPLRKPLDLLEDSKLAPYRKTGAQEITPQILDALGTRDYIQWSLEDTSISDSSAPERHVDLFVTYYTGTTGQVVHVPEECYLGGGYTQKSEEFVEVPFGSEKVPAKMLIFEKSAFVGRQTKVVAYTFSANGRFAADRQVVMTMLNSPKDKHAYFCKVEVGFGTPDASVTPERVAAAATRCLQKVLPVLVAEHLPDWAAVEREEAAGSAAVSSKAR